MTASLTSFAVVAAGGAGGAMARYALTLVTARPGQGMPVGTLVSNLLGCLAMGVLVALIARSSLVVEGGLGEHHRLLFGVGFCGAFTTLSALVFEVSGLVQRAQLTLAFTYLALTLIGGFASFYAGTWLVRAVAAEP